MKLLLDSLWRALAYCLLPRVILLSLLPLALMVALMLVLGHFFWDSAIDQIGLWLDAFAIKPAIAIWLESMGLGQLKTALSQLIIIFTVVPFLVVLAVLMVSLLMAPAMVKLVASRRFTDVGQWHNTPFLRTLVWALGSVTLALLALVVSAPLWVIPPLVLVLPPLIWGWLTYRVMAFDALSMHPTPEERSTLFRRHRPWLLIMGVVSGYVGSAPNWVWISGVGYASAFVVLAPIVVWIYTLVFAFSALWFTHYCLAALQALRSQRAMVVPPSPAFKDAEARAAQIATTL